MVEVLLSPAPLVSLDPVLVLPGPWLASLRTGIAVFALPLSVLSALIATSRYYSMEKVLPLLLPLMLLNLGLVVLGTWLVFRSIRRIRHFEHRVKELSEKYRSLAEFIE